MWPDSSAHSGPGGLLPWHGAYAYNMTAQTVLILGAGIAEPALAFWLKAAGLEPTLVERAPALRTGGYVIDFWGCGYDIAARHKLPAIYIWLSWRRPDKLRR